MNTQFCAEFDILFAAVIEKSGEVSEYAGHRASISGFDISKDLFEKPDMRNNWIDRIKRDGPRMWAQGEVICCMQLAGEALAVVWSRKTTSPGADYQRLTGALAKMAGIDVE